MDGPRFGAVSGVPDYLSHSGAWRKTRPIAIKPHDISVQVTVVRINDPAIAKKKKAAKAQHNQPTIRR